MAKFNGHKNYNHWNVSLWINNDEAMYHHAVILSKRYNKATAAVKMLECLNGYFQVTHTPDGAPYSVTTIKAAMRGL